MKRGPAPEESAILSHGCFYVRANGSERQGGMDIGEDVEVWHLHSAAVSPSVRSPRQPASLISIQKHEILKYLPSHFLPAGAH